MASTTSYNNEAEPLPWEAGWKNNLPGYAMLAGDVPNRLIFRLLVLHPIARPIWFNVYKPKANFMKGHRAYCGRILAQYALANGWTEEQTHWLLQTWRGLYYPSLNDIQLNDFLDRAMKKTEPVREKYRLEKEKKAQDKTVYQVLAFLEAVGQATPAEVAKGSGLLRNKVKVCLHRLAKAGTAQKMGRGKYSIPSLTSGVTVAVTETVTAWVKESNTSQKQVKVFPSLTQAVTGPQEEHLRQLEDEGYFDDMELD